MNKTLIEIIRYYPSTKLEFITGKFYGYPDCCIYEYILSKRGQLIANKEQLEIFKLTDGFMPCKRCTEKLNEYRTSFAELITGRISKNEFPNSDAKGLSEYLNDLDPNKLVFPYSTTSNFTK